VPIRLIPLVRDAGSFPPFATWAGVPSDFATADAGLMDFRAYVRRSLVFFAGALHLVQNTGSGFLDLPFFLFSNLRADHLTPLCCPCPAN